MNRPKIDTETKLAEKIYIRKLMKVMGLAMDMPEERKGIGVISWGFIILMVWFGIWFGYRVIVGMERGLLG